VAEEAHILIGKIVGVHGIRGNLKIFSYAESPDIFSPERPLFLRNAGGLKPADILWCSAHKKGLLLSLKAVSDRNQAEKLVGTELVIPRSELPEAEEDEYYWADIVGMDVYTEDGLFLGKIRSIMETGSNDVYVVSNGGKETLVPALADVVSKVDVEERRMTVKLPEGL